eukprot:6022595-Amphidinium_carterae.1
MLAGATVWVSLRGHLYKVAAINVRKATEDECKSVKALNDLMPELQTAAVEQRGRRRFTDVSRESPWDPGEERSTAIPSRELSRRPSASAISEQSMPMQTSESQL